MRGGLPRYNDSIEVFVGLEDVLRRVGRLPLLSIGCVCQGVRRSYYRESQGWKSGFATGTLRWKRCRTERRSQAGSLTSTRGQIMEVTAATG